MFIRGSTARLQIEPGRPPAIGTTLALVRRLAIRLKLQKSLDRTSITLGQLLVSLGSVGVTQLLVPWVAPIVVVLPQPLGLTTGLVTRSAVLTALVRQLQAQQAPRYV